MKYLSRYLFSTGVLLALLPSAHAGVTYISNPTANYTSATSLLSIGDPDGSNVNSLTDGVFTTVFNVPMTAATVPDTFLTWAAPPFSETDSPRVLINPISSLQIDFSSTVLTFGFEAEPIFFGLQDIGVLFFNGATLVGSETMTVEGDSGSRLFAASSSTGFDNVRVASTDQFAIAQVRYGNTDLNAPEPGTMALLALGLGLCVFSRRLSRIRLSRNACLATAACFIASIAHANQPAPVDVTVTSSLSLTGHSMLHLTNNTNMLLTLVFQTGDQGSIPIPSKRVVITALGQLDVDLGMLTFPMGMQIFHVQSRQFDNTQNLPIGLGPNIYEPLTVDNTGIHKMTYEGTYLDPTRYKPVPNAGNTGNDIPNVDIGGGFMDMRPINPMAFDSGIVPTTIPTTTLGYPSPMVLSRMTLLDAGTPGDGSVGQVLGAPRNPNQEVAPEADAAAARPALAAPAGQNAAGVASIQGKFFLKLPGNVYQPAWAWVVRVWQNIGVWRFVGWTYVAGDGTWSVPLDPLTALDGLPVWVEYQPANRFVQLQDANGNVYTWGDSWPVTNQTGVTNIGFRSANFTVNGDLPGVDKLYVGATQEWNKMYDNGINALRDKPIQVFFPNTLASGQCQQTDGNGNPYAWSCSYWSDGRIYIIPKHAVNTVVQHEIAHSINSYYWNGNLPAGAGGQHDLTTCYNNGLALTEGFADFIAYWVQFAPNQVAPSAPYINMNIETVPANVCQSQVAEMRVASAFWDMYDVYNDGPGGSKYDNWHFIKQGGPVTLYLNNPQNSMDAYDFVAKLFINPLMWNDVDRLFRLNYIIP